MYRSSNKVRVIKSIRMRWAGRSAFKVLSDKPTGKRPFGRWEENIRTDLKEIRINTMNWVNSVRDRDYKRAIVNAVLNIRIP